MTILGDCWNTWGKFLRFSLIVSMINDGKSLDNYFIINILIFMFSKYYDLNLIKIILNLEWLIYILINFFSNLVSIVNTPTYIIFFFFIIKENKHQTWSNIFSTNNQQMVPHNF